MRWETPSHREASGCRVEGTGRRKVGVYAAGGQLVCCPERGRDGMASGCALPEGAAVPLLQFSGWAVIRRCSCYFQTLKTPSEGARERRKPQRTRSSKISLAGEQALPVLQPQHRLPLSPRSWVSCISGKSVICLSHYRRTKWEPSRVAADASCSRHRVFESSALGTTMVLKLMGLMGKPSCRLAGRYITGSP